MEKRILIIAPHPDDEVLGCGGVMKKLAIQGNQVFVLIASRGKEGLYSEDRILNVRNEALEAHKVLGVKETRFLDFNAPELDLVSISVLSAAISEIISEFRPDTIFLPHSGDIHHDHKAVFNAGLVAVRPVNGLAVRHVYSYETLSETEWAAPKSDEIFIPTYFVNISETFSFKIEAMKCYSTQLRKFPNPRSIKAIEALSNYRGSTVGFAHAEAFTTIRNICY